MEPQDEQPEPPQRPARPRRTLPYVALQQQAGRLRQALAEAPERTRRWDDSRRSTSFVPDSDTVEIDVRRHPFLLLWPLLRTLSGVLVLAAGVSLLPLLLFAASTAVWAQVRFGKGLRTTGIVTGVTVALLVVLTALVGALPVLLVLVLMAAEDVADWTADRLVVTNRRIYRRYGVLTRHTPSIALTAIAFIDGEVPPIGRLVGYGTLRLDSVAQRDAPLARLDLVPDVTAVTHEILRLRILAMPKFPQQPM